MRKKMTWNRLCDGRGLLAAGAASALILVGLPAAGKQSTNWHLKVPVLCGRHSALTEGLKAVLDHDLDAAARAGCFKMQQPLPVHLVGEYDDGQVAKVTYKGRNGRLRTAWTLRSLVEEDK
jgi:hypothetical protein